MLRMFHWLPAVLYAGVIFALSHQSRAPGPGLAPDYVLHFAEYGGFALAILWGATSGLGDRPRVRIWAAVWLSAVFYGVLDEFHQSFIPARQASAQDVVADAAGALAALLAAHFFLVRRAKGDL